MSADVTGNPINTGLEVHPVAGGIGAEVRGVRLTGDLDALTVNATIR